MTALKDLEKIKKLSRQYDDGAITAVRLVQGYNDSYALNTEGGITALSLSDSSLKTLVLGSEASALEYLYLTGNKSLWQIVFERPLPHLTHLYLDDCALEELVIPAGLTALQQIYVQKNKLKKVVFEGDCPELVLIDASENELKQFLLPRGFGALQYIYLRKNQLELVGFHNVLPLLNTLHLAENQLTVLPSRLTDHNNMNTLYLKGNNIDKIDREFWDSDGNCWERIKPYLFSLEKLGAQKVQLHEAKMILIGNGEVGKTSIRLKLNDENAPLPAKSDRTPGLAVEPHKVMLSKNLTHLEKDIEFTLNIWDFGGQGKYRAVQQLFCSRKSLYLYVTSPDDKPENDAYIGYEYWLSMANAFNQDHEEGAKNSPIIYVQNKCELYQSGQQFINQKEIVEKGFDNIHDFVAISCETPMQNFGKLRELINAALPKISRDVFTAEYSQDWLSVKQTLENIKSQNHIRRSDFNNICSEYRLTEDEAKAWLTVLDRIGTVIYFGNNEKLKDWVVLNPIWAKDAICKILDFDFYTEVATLPPQYLPKIWKDYSDFERERLEELLIAYDFCYQEGNNYIVPALFDDKKPDYPAHLNTFDFELELRFKPYLPADMLHKLMVKLHKQIHGKLRWKSGVVIHEPIENTYAEVIENWEKHTLKLRLKGIDYQLVTLWQTIEGVISDIIHQLKETKFVKFLGYDVFCFNENDWEAISTIEKMNKKLNANLFNFLFGIENTKPEPFRGALGSLPKQPIPFESPSNNIRLFKPFKEIEESVKILFLAATPMDAKQLNTAKESRFKDLFRYFDTEKRFILKEEHGITSEQFQNFVINENPHIVHYGGHGDSEGIVLEDENLEADILVGILELSENVQCVVLNACNSLEIAKKVSQHIPYVIATKDVIEDKTAIAFAKGFYLGIVSNKSVEQAFKSGILTIQREKLNGASILVLVKNGKEI